MPVWMLLRCIFEVVGGAAGLAHVFADCQTAYDVMSIAIGMDEYKRIATVVLVAMVIGGAVETVALILEQIKGNTKRRSRR